MPKEDVKEKIAHFYSACRRMPSYAELARLAGFASKNAAYALARRLADDGILERDKTGRLVPLRPFGEACVLGTVEAGFPSAAEEELVDTMSLDEYLIRNKESTYILKVKGDSMSDAGILDGDMVVVERKSEAREGDIVIAEVDGAWTMKYYRRKYGRAYLEPANKKYKAIFPTDDMKITAIVRAVIRKY